MGMLFFNQRRYDALKPPVRGRSALGMCGQLPHLPLALLVLLRGAFADRHCSSAYPSLSAHCCSAARSADRCTLHLPLAAALRGAAEKAGGGRQRGGATVRFGASGELQVSKRRGGRSSIFWPRGGKLQWRHAEDAGPTSAGPQLRCQVHGSAA